MLWNQAIRIIKKNNDQGFTLVEVMIAVSIFSIGFLAIAMLMVTAIQSNSGARKLTEASTFAQDKMEVLLTLPLTDPNLTTGNHNDPGNPVNGIYNISWNISGSDITVSVNWNDMKGQRVIDLQCVKY